MNKKKVLIRIGSVLACVLLVGALAIPCFADDAVTPPSPPPDGYTPPYGSALDDFASSLPPRQYDTAYGGLLTYYNGFGDSRFFTISMLVLGEMWSPSSHTGLITVRNSTSDGAVDVELLLDRFEFALYTSEEEYSTVSGSGAVRLQQTFDDGTASVISIQFTNGSNPAGAIVFNYSVTHNSSGQTYTLNNIYVSGEMIDLDSLYWVDFGFVVNNYVDPYYLPTIVSLLNGNPQTYYADLVFSPKMFYNGYSASYNLGYADGERYGYQYGYDDGYADGEQYGYQNGFDDGYARGLEEGMGSESYDEAFKQGYDKAVSEIESGDFGRNLIGAGFSAPFEGLKNLTLVEWTTADGFQMRITLFTLFSAIVGVLIFVWFLKMFAGG